MKTTKEPTASRGDALRQDSGQAEHAEEIGEFTKSLYLRTAVGTIKDGKGQSYDVTNTMPGGAIHILSKQTGRVFLVTPQEVVRLARQRGIDNPE